MGLGFEIGIVNWDSKSLFNTKYKMLVYEIYKS